MLIPCLHVHVAVADSQAAALDLVEKLESTCKTLSIMPERGQLPSELERAGIYQYRQIHYKPYRIIYEISDKDIFILCILDGRRDLIDSLTSRLLRPDS